jgi:hypothetical protein
MKLETSKGERNISISKGKLILTSCELPELGIMLSKSYNIIRTLHPFISGQAAFEDDYNTEDDKVLGSESPLMESPPPRISKKLRTRMV